MGERLERYKKETINIVSGLEDERKAKMIYTYVKTLEKRTKS